MIKDSGVGIAPNNLEKLFTRFGQVHRTAQMNHDGLGLGLLIVKQIIDLNGGKVTVESEGIGYGSTFTFTMQMEKAEIDES